MFAQIGEMNERVQALRARGVCVIIPTYNNVGTIADVVERTLVQCQDVIVVCDGCTDGTEGALSEYASRITLLSLPENRGKGAALKTGFRHALEAGFSYAITLDGDGQHLPEEIPVLLEASRQHPGAIVTGERKGLDKVNRSRGSRFANSFGNFWFALQTFRALHDTQSGFRLYPLKKLPPLALIPRRYDSEVALLVWSRWRGVELAGIPIEVYYPPREERVSHFRPARDFIRIFILNTILCIIAPIYGWPSVIVRRLTEILRFAFVLFSFALTTTLVITPCARIYLKSDKLTWRKKEKVHTLVRRVTSKILNVVGIPGMRYSSANPNNETFKEPAVIICNHQSHLDLIPILALTDKLVVVTADWVWKNPFYGSVIRSIDFIPASEGLDSTLPKMQELVARGYSIALFPEGTRSADRRTGRFHQGAFKIAESLGIDIIPLVLYGTGLCMPKYGIRMRRWPVRLEIDRRITPEELAAASATTRGRASYMRKYYIRRYREIADRIEQDV